MDRSIFEQASFLSGVDGEGKYWEISRGGTVILKMREADLLALVDWVVRELGWLETIADREEDIG